MASEGAARRGRRTTIADVAQAAGVSRTTVSFVLNGTRGQTIPESTRQRVLQAAERLRYAPSAEARALRRGRSDVVLLYLAPELPLTTDLGQLLEHLAAMFAAAGLTVIAQPWTRYPDTEVSKAITPAVVLAWHLDEDSVTAMRRNGVQVVVSLTDGSDPVARWVWGAREETIARLQVGRLVEAGHRRLGYALPHDRRLAEASRKRLEALQRACAEHGLPDPVALPVPADDGAHAAVASWRAMTPAVTGVCAHDDVAALAVLAGLRRHGLSAPADLAVIGVIDSPAARLACPPLTMVTVDMRATARYTVDVVTALLEGAPLPPAPEVVGLIERMSV
ncbi:LacI family DNA-binding transcriptional regulator [Actinocorallia populi]|uniref:LacI family DNA-binding transcriptional regulator n=1 Tax=Actinocorallia populi TaxID=2079200 RepID=UPI000D097174|nr:LacI family DNA-binding transcriptional regulator [Actinocorallia populi]